MTNQRAEWLKQRRTGIGGSDVAPILGLSKWRTAREVYEEKVGELESDEATNADRKAMGHRLQRPIIDEYCEVEGVKLVEYEPPMLRHPDLPFLFASLDAVVENEHSDVWNLDAKNVHWRAADAWGDEGGDQLPDDAFYQGHQYNAITGRHKTDFAVLVGGEWPPRKYTVPLDLELFGMIAVALEKFWWHVELKRPVPPDFAHATTTALMQRLYPDVDPRKTIEISASYEELAVRYYTLGRASGAADKARKLMKGELLFAMGDAAEARIGGTPWVLRRAKVAPRCCKACGYSAKEGDSVRFEIRLPKSIEQPPALDAAAMKLIEGKES